jgi:hypothetical protein
MANRRHKVPARPEVFADKTLLPPAICPGNVNCTLPLQLSHPLRYRIFGRNRQQHMYVVGLQMPFFDATLFLPR